MELGKVWSGARARCSIYDSNTNTAQVVGIFNNVTWGLAFMVEEAPILGRMTIPETTNVGVSTVQVTATGWRCIDFGPHVVAAFPHVQDLLTAGYIDFEIADRGSEAAGKGQRRVTRITKCRPTGYSTGVAGRTQSEITCTFLGTLCHDESGTNEESPGAADLPG